MTITPQLIGIFSGILTSVSMVPQFIKLVKEKNSKDLSIKMLVILLTGLAGWIYYGVLKTDIIIIVTNSFSFVLTGMTIVLGIKYKK